MRSYGSRLSMVAVLVLALLLSTFGAAERAASADLPGERSAPLAAGTLCVCASGCDYPTINGAVANASSGDTIMVAQGTYNEVVVAYNKSLTIFGGYSNSSCNVRDPATYKTFIKANSSQATVKLAGPGGGTHTGTLDGFYIEGGNNSGQGGGVFVSHYRATISNNRIYSNRAAGGGGISVYDSTDVVIEDNEIYDNRATSDGGGIRVEDSTVSIIGNTIRSNRANYGGGISARDSAVNVDDNTIRRNVADSGGAGMQFIKGSTGSITNNRLEDNDAGVNPGGGGIHFYQCKPQYGGAPDFVGNTVTGNTADNAGGGVNVEDSSPLIRDNLIQGNHAGEQGGGINMSVGSTPNIIHNTISGNTSSARGGGVFGTTSAPFMRRNEIVDNQAPTGGGVHLAGAAGFEIVNNIIARNKSTVEGGGIQLTSNSRGNIINNTLVNNSLEAIDLRNSVKPRIANNILMGHTYGVRVREEAAPTVEYNDVFDCNINYDGVSGNPGHISCDPQFVNLGAGDYHLTAGSCVIDNGTQTGAPTNDFDGDSRPLDGDEDGTAAWDRGADEYFNPVWVTKDVNDQVLDPGDPVTFTIVYRNYSGSTVTGVVISDILSDDLVNSSYDFSGPNITKKGSTRYVWDVENLAPGEQGTITINAQVNPSISSPKAISNEVSFQMNGYGPFEDEVLMVIAGLETYTPAALDNYAQ